MARVTQADVRGVLNNDYNTDISLTPFIASANLLVDWVDSCDNDGDLSTADLKQIEMWLAAHFYACNDLPYDEKKTQDASAVFQGKSGMYLESTRYGQMALALDHSGCLSRRQKELTEKQKPKVSFDWLGLEPEDQDND